MDSNLRAYLEQPAPRPVMHDGRFDDRRLRWLFPLGAAFTGALVVVPIVRDRSEWFLGGALAWCAGVLAAAAAGRVMWALNQRLFRTGVFAQARVLETVVHSDGEDSSLEVTLGVEVAHPSADYRSASAPKEKRYSMPLSERWLRDGGATRFALGATFPILVSTKGRSALVFVNDEALGAGAV